MAHRTPGIRPLQRDGLVASGAHRPVALTTVHQRRAARRTDTHGLVSRPRHLSQQRSPSGLPLSIQFPLNLRQRRVWMDLSPLPHYRAKIVSLLLVTLLGHRSLPLASALSVKSQRTALQNNDAHPRVEIVLRRARFGARVISSVHVADIVST